MLMEKDKVNVALKGLRENIDAIDDEIIKLLKTRSSHVKEVGEIKHSLGIEGSFIRPGREADMIRKITKHFEGEDFPKETAAAIWRMIIGASLAMESPINTAIHCPDNSLVPYFMAREYFGGVVKSAIYQNTAKVVLAAEEDKHTVGVISLQDNSDLPLWWLQLAMSTEPVFIFACIPFVQRLSGTAAENPFLAFTQAEPEDTGDDISYLVAFFDYPLPDNPGALIKGWLESGEFRGTLANMAETSEDSWAGLIKLKGFAAKESNNGLFHELNHHLMQSSDGSLADLKFIGAHAAPILV